MVGGAERRNVRTRRRRNRGGIVALVLEERQRQRQREGCGDCVGFWRWIYVNIYLSYKGEQRERECVYLSAVFEQVEKMERHKSGMLLMSAAAEVMITGFRLWILVTFCVMCVVLA